MSVGISSRFVTVLSPVVFALMLIGDTELFEAVEVVALVLVDDLILFKKLWRLEREMNASILRLTGVPVVPIIAPETRTGKSIKL